MRGISSRNIGGNGSNAIAPLWIWDRQATLEASFPDGTANTIMFAEKYSRCDNSAGIGGVWWMRGVFLVSGGSDDSYPGDRFSGVFGGGIGQDGVAWQQGQFAFFQVQPLNPLNATGTVAGCDKTLASTSHHNMQVAMSDGAVKSISPSMTKTTWAALLTPNGGDSLGPDWTQQ
jgi:hypothetical protein